MGWLAGTTSPSRLPRLPGMSAAGQGKDRMPGHPIIGNIKR